MTREDAKYWVYIGAVATFGVFILAGCVAEVAVVFHFVLKYW